jgi:hypothetical protein
MSQSTITLPWHAHFILGHRILLRPAIIYICGFNFQGAKKHSKKPLPLKLTHYPQVVQFILKTMAKNKSIKFYPDILAHIFHYYNTYYYV